MAHHKRTDVSVELIVFSGLLLSPTLPPPQPLTNYYFGNSRTHACIVCRTQPDLLSQAQQPSRILLSLMADAIHDTFCCRTSYTGFPQKQCIAALYQISRYYTLCMKPFAIEFERNISLTHHVRLGNDCGAEGLLNSQRMTSDDAALDHNHLFSVSSAFSN